MSASVLVSVPHSNNHGANNHVAHGPHAHDSHVVSEHDHIATSSNDEANIGSQQQLPANRHTMLKILQRTIRQVFPLTKSFLPPILLLNKMMRMTKLLHDLLKSLIT